MSVYRSIGSVDVANGDCRWLVLIANNARRAGIKNVETHPLTRWAWGVVSDEVKKLAGQKTTTGIFYYDEVTRRIHVLEAL